MEREYAVVGTWEHTNETLAVLEAYVPRYFADASKMYYCKYSRATFWVHLLHLFASFPAGMHGEKANDNPMKPRIRSEIIDLVRRNFTREIEFYQFCRQRLHKQYLALKLKDLMRLDNSLAQLKSTNELALRD